MQYLKSDPPSEFGVLSVPRELVGNQPPTKGGKRLISPHGRQAFSGASTVTPLIMGLSNA